MTPPPRLPRAMRAYRFGDSEGRFPVWSVDGAKRDAGRWHQAGAEVVYASERYSTAMLEKLVRMSVEPIGQRFVEIDIPAGVSYEVATADIVPGWADRDQEASRRFGRKWYDEKRSAILFVPSVVAREERNLVFNARHPDFRDIESGRETPLWWDPRLFASPESRDESGLSLIDQALSAL